MSQPIDWTLSKWIISPLVNIYRESLEALWYGQIRFSHGSLFIWNEKWPFNSKDDNEELLGLKVPYLNAISALIYLANCTRPNITFSINLLARYSSIGIELNMYQISSWNNLHGSINYIQNDQNLNYLDMLMVAIFQTFTKFYLKWSMYLPVVVCWYHGD